MIASPPIETAVDWPRPAADNVEDISVVIPPEREITPTGVELVEGNLDECVLCELCINAAALGTIRVLKLYSGESLPAD